jgi:large subunit ribosomal protein L4
MKAKLYSQDGKEKGVFELPDDIFNAEVNETVMHSVVKALLANQRQGTHKAKTRAEVSGGGRKPFKQKGTGRARAGSNTSPVWVRGGTIFGPKPREYGGTIPKKLRRIALRSAYTTRAKEEKILVVDQIKIELPKTKSVVEIFTTMAVRNKKNLLIIGDDDRNVFLSGRNVKNVSIKCVKDVNVYDILKHENIIFSSENLIEKVKEVVAP